MRRILIILYVLNFSLLFSQVRYLEDTSIYDQKNGYNISIGQSPNFVFRHYGEPTEKKVIWEVKQPDYTVYEAVYDTFTIEYNTYDNIITSIKTSEQSFLLERGISVGMSKEDVLKCYGTPNFSGFSKNYDNQELLIYQSFIPEFCYDGEYYAIYFYFNEGVISRIFLRIDSSV